MEALQAGFSLPSWAFARALLAIGAIPGALIAQTSGEAGIKVGDSVEVVTGFGWTPARVLAISGNSYRVVTNGVQVTKDYPVEVRRIGAATAQDHANGQYRLGDRVQVNVEGQWIDARIITEMGMDYQVELPGNRTAWASPQTLRPAATTPAAASAPKSGVPPRPGLSWAWVEGRYATPAALIVHHHVPLRQGHHDGSMKRWCSNADWRRQDLPAQGGQFRPRHAHRHQQRRHAPDTFEKSRRKGN